MFTAIGSEVAKGLANRGARLVLASRDLERCEVLRRRMQDYSGNYAITCAQLDLARLDSVYKFALYVARCVLCASWFMSFELVAYWALFYVWPLVCKLGFCTMYMYMCIYLQLSGMWTAWWTPLEYFVVRRLATRVSTRSCSAAPRPARRAPSTSSATRPQGARSPTTASSCSSASTTWATSCSRSCCSRTLRIRRLTRLLPTLAYGYIALVPQSLLCDVLFTHCHVSLYTKSTGTFFLCRWTFLILMPLVRRPQTRHHRRNRFLRANSRPPRDQKRRLLRLAPQALPQSPNPI